MLAAGYGTRLEPITSHIPKCLVPIAGKPLLGYWLDLMHEHNVNGKIYINLHHLPNQVRKYVKDNYPKANIEFLEELDILGTGFTVASLLPKISQKGLLVVHADNFSIFNLTDFFRTFESRPSECVGTLMSFKTDKPSSSGILKVKNGIVVEFHEKVKNPPGNLASAAVAILDKSFSTELSNYGLKEGADFSRDVLSRLINRMNVFHNDTYHIDIGTIESYLKANFEFPIWQKFLHKG